MRVQNRMVVQQLPWHANMTEKNHLGKALLIAPEKMEGRMNQLFSSYVYSENPLTRALAGKHEEEIGNTEWEYKLRAANRRPLVSMGLAEPPSNTTPGKFRQPFRMRLDEPWWLPGDIIHPGTSDKRFQVRIQEQPIKVANGYEYVVRGNWDDPQMFIPLEHFNVGRQWAKLFSQYEEAAEQSGSTQYSMPIWLKGRMGRYRKKYEVTGDVANQVLSVRMAGKDGKLYDTWVKYAEAEYWSQWYREIETGYWYSRSTDTVLGANGRPTLSGPGVQELLEDSHIHRYSHLSARLIEEFLMDVFYSRVEPGPGRQISAYTGEYGMLNFHRAVEDVLSKKGIMTIIDSNFKVEKTSSPYHENALSFGYQFTKFRMFNGAVLTLVHNPLYDDRSINFEIDPVTGYPVESQRITFLDFAPGKGGTSSNLEIKNLKNGFKLGYRHGLQTPYGPVNNGPMAHSGDYYEVHVQKQTGIHIEDTSRCGELILSRN